VPAPQEGTIVRSRKVLVLSACAPILMAACLSAYSQQIFVANSSNGRITVFDLSGASTPFNGNTSSLVTPLGITLDAAGGLIVCDNQRGRIVRYAPTGAGPSVLASDIARPDGPSFGSGGDLFFVTSPDGASSSKVKDVFVLPGGSGPPVKIASLSDSRLLRDTAVVPLGPFAGQLLVLSSKPAFIARFSQVSPTSYVREPNFASGFSGEPSGMAITPLGDLLVSGTDGVVRRFDSAGNRLADFAAGLGNGQTRIAVGTDGTVYVTNRNRPALFRFDASGARLSDFGGSLQSPAGVAVHEFAPTPVGQNVTVTPIPGVVVTYDSVVEAGFTSAERTFLDPGETTTPCGNVIPAFAAPPAGDDHFTVIQIETTAGTTDSIEIDLAHPDGNSRGFHAACPPHADGGFVDVTVLAVPGDPRMHIPQFSEFAIVTDTRPNSDVIRFKLNSLTIMLGPGSPSEQFIEPATLQTLRTFLNNASFHIGVGDNPRAIEELRGLIAAVRAGSGTTIPNSASSPGGNIAGGLVSLADTLIFSLSL